MNEQTLPIEQIRIDGGTQPRQSLDEETIQQYAQQMIEGEAFPLVTVYQDGVDLWLADGFHRYHAARKAGRTEIAADVHPGTRRDAILFSVGANAAHGLRRTNADKRKAVMTLLEDEQWSTWPQTDIAKACVVSREYVCRLAAQISSSCARSQDAQRQVCRGNSVYEQDTTGISQANRKPRPSRSAPRISPKAMTPVLGHSDPAPRTALALPHDAVLAAKAMIELFDEMFLVELVDELSNLLAGGELLSLPEEKPATPAA